MSEIDQIVNQKGTLKKEDKEKITHMYKSFYQEIKSNLPFLQECLDEAVDDSIKLAKSEVESFWLNRIMSLGITKMIEQAEKSEVNLLGE